MSRTLAQIDREIFDATQLLSELHAERAAWVRERIEGICREYRAGMSRLNIAKARRMSLGTVNGILWREGLTENGRTAIKAKLRGEHQADAVAP